MPRQKNDIETDTITISTTPHVRGYLEQLVTTGLYGKNPAEAAERLVTRQIEALLERGQIEKTRVLKTESS